MQRKRWTPNKEVSDSLLQFRQKRKWQIALRRYVLERHKSSFYAPYFGLSIDGMRKWIEIQFEVSSDWGNFSTAWQFDHVVPVAYFDFEKEEELLLCWNFTNIRVANLMEGKNAEKPTVLGAKRYFEALYAQTGYGICHNMIKKIEALEEAQSVNSQELVEFINGQKDCLFALQSFDAADFEKMNTGTAWQDVVFEKDLLKKFGG